MAHSDDDDDGCAAQVEQLKGLDKDAALALHAKLQEGSEQHSPLTARHYASACESSSS